MTTATLDPMAAAVQDAEAADQYFGKMEVDAQFVILKKGERKTVWLEGMDTDGRTTEITFRLNPLDVSGMTRMVERSAISNFGEWSRVIWPSLRDLGVKELRTINGKFAHVQMVKNGRSWTNKEGATVEGTTFKFIALYDTEAACIAAWESVIGGSQAHTPSSNGTAPQQAPAGDDMKKRETALQFLPALVKGCNGDRTMLAQTLANMPLISPFFTIDSPEVQALLAA